jgi:hypothetical protein
MTEETRGSKRQGNSKRSRLERMRPGDVEVFTCAPGASVVSLQNAIASDIAKHLKETRSHYSQRKALLVFDESTLPVACSVVTRKGEILDDI